MAVKVSLEGQHTASPGVFAWAKSALSKKVSALMPKFCSSRVGSSRLKRVITRPVSAVTHFGTKAAHKIAWRIQRYKKPITLPLELLNGFTKEEQNYLQEGLAKINRGDFSKVNEHGTRRRRVSLVYIPGKIGMILHNKPISEKDMPQGESSRVTFGKLIEWVPKECRTKDVALVKVIKKRKQNYEIATQQGRLASEALIRQEHPNIAKALLNVPYTSSKKDPVRIVVYERMGGDLESMSASLSFDQAKNVLRDTLEGLEFLHSQGLAHNDLNRGNILVRTEGSQAKAQLSDFESCQKSSDMRGDLFNWSRNMTRLFFNFDPETYEAIPKYPDAIPAKDYVELNKVLEEMRSDKHLSESTRISEFKGKVMAVTNNQYQGSVAFYHSKVVYKSSLSSRVCAVALFTLAVVGLTVATYLTVKYAGHSLLKHKVIMLYALATPALLKGSHWAKSAHKMSVLTTKILATTSPKLPEDKYEQLINDTGISPLEEEKTLLKLALTQHECGNLNKIGLNGPLGARRVVSMVNQNGYKGFILHAAPKDENALMQGGFSRMTSDRLFYFENGKWNVKEIATIKCIKRDKNDPLLPLQEKRKNAEEQLNTRHPQLCTALFRLEGTSASGHARVLSVYEKMDGDLFSKLEKQVSDDWKLRAFEQILDGVKSLHDQGLVHRDLKPENILYQGDRVAIADFEGMVLEGSNETSFGTRGYLPPNIKFYNTKQQDFYALGVILYDLFPSCSGLLKDLADKLKNNEFSSIDYAKRVFRFALDVLRSA